jgi:hypothetical protein
MKKISLELCIAGFGLHIAETNQLVNLNHQDQNYEIDMLKSQLP